MVGRGLWLTRGKRPLAAVAVGSTQWCELSWRPPFLTKTCLTQQPCCCLVTKLCLIVYNLTDAARQAPLSFTISRSWLKFMSTESVMPSNRLILCCPLLPLPSVFPSIRVFYNESVLCIRWPCIGASASASVLPMNILG